MTLASTVTSLKAHLEDEHGLQAFFKLVKKKDEPVVDVAIRELALNAALTQSSKGRLVASLWAAGKRILLAELMDASNEFRDPAVIGKATSLLDGPRRLRRLKRIMEQLTPSNPEADTPNAKKATRHIRRLRAKAKEIERYGIPEEFSATASFMRTVRKWIRTIPAERLEFDCVMFDRHEVWAAISDLAHPAPKDWALPFFQSVVHGGKAPEGSMVADMRAMTSATLVEMLGKYPKLADAYSVVRQRVPPKQFTDEVRAALATSMPLSDLIWNYEEIAGMCDGRHASLKRSAAARNIIDEAITLRVHSGEALVGGNFTTDNFGKLLERMLMLRKVQAPWWTALLPVAESTLEALKERKELRQRSAFQVGPSASGDEADWELISNAASEAPKDEAPAGAKPQVAVLGDASASMQVAINAACIVGAMMSALFDADLVFFNGKSFRATTHASPRTAAQVLDVAEEVQAGGSTSPAAALYPFLEQGKKVDLFLVVTDEEENTAHNGRMFAETLKRYKETVNPNAQVTFISFLRQSDKGTMLKRLEQQGVTAGQQRFDPSRPDLSKFDNLFRAILLNVVTA